MMQYAVKYEADQYGPTEISIIDQRDIENERDAVDVVRSLREIFALNNIRLMVRDNSEDDAPWAEVEVDW